ncbi:MAG: S41 family peptidase [Chitinophagaceae bacterium]
MHQITVKITLMGNKKLQVWLPLIFSAVLIIGMFLGFGLNPGGSNRSFFSTTKNTSLQEALDIIRLKYVDKVNTDSLETGAIQQMMSELDPHSVYFPPIELKEANEELAGNFDGIGVEFNVFNDTVNVLYVLPGGPSDKAGLLIGDKILKANGFSLAEKNLPTDSIKKHIRGESGSTVTLQIERMGQLQSLNVTRGSIPVPSVDASYMIDQSTGYIKLNKFTATSYEEFMKALETLQTQGLKQLVFDIRGNGGGFMDEAIDMADELLDGDKLVVYTEGTNSKKKEYRCKRPGLLEKGKVMVLVDEFSASASEVFSGAVQDWCRATIIGRRTFGKGLVQEQYNLSDGSALRLTIARYYTPVGRSIQRPYDKGKKEYMDELWQRFSNGEVLYADSNKHNGKEYKNTCGKVVYGGGGITPDIFVPIDTATYPVAVNKLLQNGSFNNFVYIYYLKNRQLIDKLPSTAAYIQHFDQPTDLWSQFVNYVPATIDLNNLSANQKASLQRRLEAYLARFRWRNNGYYQVLNADDAVVKKAMEEIQK